MKTFNVNSYNQQGGITAGQLNIGKQPRKLREELKQQLVSALPEKKQCIRLSAIMDHEAFNFADEIKEFLKSKNYDVDGVNQCLYTTPIKGQIIEKTEEGSINIIIGGA